MKMKISVLLVAVCVITWCTFAMGKENPKLYNIIFIGATGDLAKKYLWKALFNLFAENYEKGKVDFMIYGCGTKSADDGRKIMSDILLNIVLCTDDKCRQIKKHFIECTQYNQLKTEKHYEGLSQKIEENTRTIYGMSETHYTYEEGRLVYMAIPPSSYTKTAARVNKFLRPKVGRPWFRVVLEKPFGLDSSSAKSLASKLGKSFQEEEIYRIDHYLGKSVVKLILPFRYMNRELFEPLWNRDFIERVEIVMKETVGCEERISFYDDVGIIRDVMQNHLTEMATLVAMELPENSGNISEILNNKWNVLRSILPLTTDSTVIGQYSTYPNEARVELKNPDHLTSTPTFAASNINVNNQKWSGVPFIFVSGKKLDRKESYIRLLFKDRTFCVHSDSKKCGQHKQIIFYIGGNDIRVPPMILVSKALLRPVDFPKWRFEDVTSDKLLFGENMTDMYVIMPNDDADAYSALVKAVFQGERHLFIDSKSLLLSWDIWTPLLKELKPQHLRVYDKEDKSDILNLEITGLGQLQYIQKATIINIDDGGNIKSDESAKFGHIPSTFRDQVLISDEKSFLIAKLAESIKDAANRAIRDHGTFHVAFPGGMTPTPLFKYLAKSYATTFPWQQTHIWLVDERCVPLNDPKSNFNNLNQNLLRFISIPFLNIHPMPVHISHEPCNDGGTGASQYTELFSRLVPDKQLDFILLGVGTDAHIASLFPDMAALDAETEVVAYTDARPEDKISKRMTLTFPMINQAHQVALLVTGKEKHDIVQRVSDTPTDYRRYPVTGVRPHEGNLTWFIDHDALLGT